MKKKRLKQVRRLRRKWRKEQKIIRHYLKQRIHLPNDMHMVYVQSMIRALGVGIVICTSAIKNSEKRNTVIFIHNTICQTLLNSASHYKFRSTGSVHATTYEDQLISEQLIIMLNEARDNFSYERGKKCEES